MTGGVVNIGYMELVAASLLMLVAGVVSWRLRLGQTRRIAISTVDRKSTRLNSSH